MPVFELEKEGRKFQVDAPDRAAALAGFEKYKPPEQPQQQSTGMVGQVLRGAARGGAGLLESLHDLDPMQLLPGTGPAREMQEQIHRPIREFANAPAEGTAESVGRFAGQTLPFMALPGGAAAAVTRGAAGRFVAVPALARLARAVGPAAVAGGLQPTESGTLGSHLEGAVTGGLGGAVSPWLGRALQHPIGRRVAAEAARLGGMAALHSAGAGIFSILPEVLGRGYGGWGLRGLAHRAAPYMGRGLERAATRAAGPIGGAAAQLEGGTSRVEKTEGRRPEEPRKPPVQSSQPVARRPRGAEYRDNGPAAAERVDRGWSDFNDFRRPQGQAGETR